MSLVLPADFSALLQAALDGGPQVGFAYTPANGAGEPELVAGPEEPPAAALSELFGSAQDLNLVVGSFRQKDGQLYVEVSDLEHPSFALELVEAEAREPLLAGVILVGLGELDAAEAPPPAASEDDGWDDWGEDDWGEAEAPAPPTAGEASSAEGAATEPEPPSLDERLAEALAALPEAAPLLAALDESRAEVDRLLGPRAAELARVRRADRTFHQLLGFVLEQGGKASFRDAWGMLDELVPALQGAVGAAAILARPLGEQAELARELEATVRSAAELDLALALLLQEAEAVGHPLPWEQEGPVGLLGRPVEAEQAEAAEAVISEALERVQAVVAGAGRFRLEARSSAWAEHVGAGLAGLDLAPVVALAASGERSEAAEALFEALEEGRRALEEALSAARNAAGWADRLPRRQRKVAARNLLAAGAECHAWLVAARATALLTEDF